MPDSNLTLESIRAAHSAEATAALLSGKVRAAPGDVIVSILSGGNIELERLKTLI